MSDDLTELCNKLTARIAARLPKGVDVQPERLTHAILGTVVREIAKRDSRAQRAEASLERVRAWLASDPVTGRNEFGEGYREALRDIADVLDGKAVFNESDLADPPSPDQGTEPVRWNVCPDCFDSHPGGAACYGEDAKAGPPSLDQGAGETANPPCECDPDRPRPAPGDLCMCGDPHSEHACPDACMAFREGGCPCDGFTPSQDQGASAAPALPEQLASSIECVLFDHHKELEGDEVDANLAELAYVYKQLTGYDALEEIAHDEAHAALEERFKDASTWTEETT